MKMRLAPLKDPGAQYLEVVIAVELVVEEVIYVLIKENAMKH
jgi:hypothetical protein